MAWTRAWTSGAELASAIEHDLYDGSNPSITTNATYVHTGVRAYLLNSSGSFGKTFDASTTQMRGAFWLKHSGADATAGRPAVIFRWPGAGVDDDYIAWNNNSNLLEMYVNGSTVDSAAETAGGFSTTGQWLHCAMVAYANATTGWVSFYLDGTKILSATGVNTSGSFGGLYLTGNVDFINGWSIAASGDDIYVDTGTGSEADEAMTLKQFGWRTVNAAGDHAELTPSAGSNYQNVDDSGANDGDSTYNYAESSGLQDAYNTTSYSIPSGHVVVAEIAVAVAKKTGSGEQIKVGFTDGSNDSLSSAQNVTADYLPYYYRSETQPDSTAWNETDGDAMQILIESAGTYS